MKILVLTLTIVITTLSLLTPWLLNGAPYIGDSWTHLKKAKSIMESNRISMNEYNDMWPLVNLLLVFYSNILNINLLTATQLIPFLVSLSIINIYLIVKKISNFWNTGVAAGIAFAFTPLYTFITFGSAIMKETASLYLTTAIIAYVISNKMKYSCFVLLALGLILGHHFASLAIILLLITLTIESFLEHLAGETNEWIKILIATIIFTSFAICWIIYIILKIGWFMPINLNSLIMISWIWLGSYIISRISRIGAIIFQLSLIPLASLAWRGHLHNIPTPTIPISIWEIRDIFIFLIPSLIGLAKYWKQKEVRSFLISTSTLIAFSLTWSLDIEGLVIFTKSLHYYAIMLAIIFGLSIPFILKRKFGKTISIIIMIYLILASTTGIALALDGPGAYHQQEYLQVKGLTKILSSQTMMDVKLGYLAEYFGLEYTSFHKPKPGEYILLTRTDYTHGVLLGYVWVKLSIFLPYEMETLCDRLIDGSYVKLFRTNVI
jgi:hypothetical protein